MGLCGSGGSIHPDYLKLAYTTGGSIHTIEEDILNLARLNEGEIIKIAGRSYKIRNGEFGLVNNRY